MNRDFRNYLGNSMRIAGIGICHNSCYRTEPPYMSPLATALFNNGEGRPPLFSGAPSLRLIHGGTKWQFIDQCHSPVVRSRSRWWAGATGHHRFVGSMITMPEGPVRSATNWMVAVVAWTTFIMRLMKETDFMRRTCGVLLNTNQQHITYNKGQLWKQHWNLY